MTDSKITRVPKELDDFLKQEAERRNRSKQSLYEQLADELKGIPPLLRRKKDDKPPYAF
jgi:hypothetical protein